MEIYLNWNDLNNFLIYIDLRVIMVVGIIILIITIMNQISINIIIHNSLICTLPILVKFSKWIFRRIFAFFSRLGSITTLIYRFYFFSFLIFLFTYVTEKLTKNPFYSTIFISISNLHIDINNLWLFILLMLLLSLILNLNCSFKDQYTRILFIVFIYLLEFLCLTEIFSFFLYVRW